jgi:hypothetical protein
MEAAVVLGVAGCALAVAVHRMKRKIVEDEARDREKAG